MIKNNDLKGLGAYLEEKALTRKILRWPLSVAIYQKLTANFSEAYSIKHLTFSGISFSFQSLAELEAS